jgi:hypothetical protein
MLKINGQASTHLQDEEKNQSLWAQTEIAA